MSDVRLFSMEELEAGLNDIRRSPCDGGLVEMIVRRPREGEREELEVGELDRQQGLVGDNWLARGSRRTTNGAGHPDMQLTLMNARAVALLAGQKDRWQLAGDQFYVDLDLSVENLPPGTRLQLGDAVIEVTAEPHTGCRLFKDRFGADAVTFVNSPVGKQLRLRGVNAKVVQGGSVRVGDTVHKR